MKIVGFEGQFTGETKLTWGAAAIEISQNNFRNGISGQETRGKHPGDLTYLEIPIECPDRGQVVVLCVSKDALSFWQPKSGFIGKSESEKYHYWVFELPDFYVYRKQAIDSLVAYFEKLVDNPMEIKANLWMALTLDAFNPVVHALRCYYGGGSTTFAMACMRTTQDTQKFKSLMSEWRS